MKRAGILAICGVASAQQVSLITPTEETWASIRRTNLYARNIWEGMYLGLNGPTSQVDKIDEDCFGDWIPDDIEYQFKYLEDLAHNGIWTMTYDDTIQYAYNCVDLMFLNDEYCHFRESFWNVFKCFKEEDSPCKLSEIGKNFETNSFAMITQIS